MPEETTTTPAPPPTTTPAAPQDHPPINIPINIVPRVSPVQSDPPAGGDNGGKEEKPAEAPVDAKSIVSQEQLDQLLNGVRQQEKSKLYKTIENLKTQVKTLQGQPPEPTQQSVSSDKSNEGGNGNQQEKNQSSAPQGTTSDPVSEAFSSMVEAITALSDKVSSLETEKAQENLAQVRADVIAKAKAEAEADGEDLVEELIVGNTREELVASAAKAREAYRKYAQAFEEKLPQTVKNALPRPMNVSTTDRKPGETIVDNRRPEDLSSAEIRDRRVITPEEWPSLAEKVKASVLKKHGIPLGRSDHGSGPRLNYPGR